LRNIILFTKVRFQSIASYAELTSKLYTLSKSQPLFANLKDLLLGYIFDPLTNESIFPDKIAIVMFLYWLHYKSVFTTDEIIAQVMRIHDEHPTYKRTLCLLFCYFAPEIACAIPEVYDTIVDVFVSHATDLSFPSAFKSFFLSLDHLKADNWTEFHSMIRDGRCFQPVKEAIRRDDVDRIRVLLDSGDFDFSRPIDSEVYEPCVLAHDLLNPLAYAALCGSVLVFHFLRMRGLKASGRDTKYYTISHFAAVGGSFEVIGHVGHGNASADGFMQIAAKFFRATQYAALEHDPDTTKPDKFGQILIHVAAAANNVAVAVHCLRMDPEQINLRESFGVLFGVSGRRFTQPQKEEAMT
jgi:hypothetical protein